MPGVSLTTGLPLLLLGAIGATSYAVLRMAGARDWGLPLAMLIGAALALGWGLARLWVAPYLLAATIEIAAITIVLAALRHGLRRRERQTEAELLALFAAGAALIPIYLFVDYGWRLVI